MIAWILFAVTAVALLVVLVRGNEANRRLADAEARLAAAATQGTVESSVIREPVAVIAGGGHVPLQGVAALGDTEKRLHSSLAEVKRLEAGVADVEKRLLAEREKSEAALSRATVAEAMVAQTRSRATEAGHAATLEARKETETVRAELADAERRVLALSEPEKRLGELTRAAQRAEAEAEAETERNNTLQSEMDMLRASLTRAEAAANAATFAVTAARAESEKTLRDLHETRLREARSDFERDVETRLTAERERFESEQRRLLLELEKLRLTLTHRDSVPPVSEESELPTRPRTRPVPTKNTEIGSGQNEKPLVIIADSDANAVRTISQHLEAGGYAVRSSNSVADAIYAARNSSPVAFAIDSTNLPDGDIWSVLASVKEDPELKEIPVLIFAPSKDKERAMEMGAAGCFAKPIDKAVLVATIKAATVKRKQRARLAAASGGASVARRSTPTASQTP